MSPGSSVSVVIPTRNRGALLRAAVESALASPADEIIVADGGSDDGSIEPLAALERVRVVRGDYRNAAQTRNAGAAAARGDYLGFLDSDDLMLPEKVTCLGRALDRDEGIGLVHGRIAVIDADGAESPATAEHEEALRLAERAGLSYEALAAVCVMFTSATLMRRRAFEQIGGYDESLDVYEDWDLYLRLSVGWRLTYEDCRVAQYRIWAGNVRWDRTARGVVDVARKHLAAPAPGLSPAARYGFYRRLAGSHHILLERRATQRAALQAARIRPLGALADAGVRGPALRSLLPRALVRRRRPPLGGR